MRSELEQVPPRAACDSRDRRRAARPLAALLAALLLAAASAGIGLPAGAQDKPLGEARTPDGKIRVEVLSLKRIEGSLVTLRWQIVNDGSANFSMTPGNARLIDLAGRRQYEPGLYSTQCLSKPDERTPCWATFAAPPSATKTVAVQFYEQFELVIGIPVTD